MMLIFHVSINVDGFCEPQTKKCEQQTSPPPPPPPPLLAILTIELLFRKLRQENWRWCSVCKCGRFHELETK